MSNKLEQLENYASHDSFLTAIRFFFNKKDDDYIPSLCNTPFIKVEKLDLALLAQRGGSHQRPNLAPRI